MSNLKTEYGPCWYIVSNNGTLIVSGHMEDGQQTSTIYTIHTFDNEDAYRERYKELTGEYPPIEEDEGEGQ